MFVNALAPTPPQRLDLDTCGINFSDLNKNIGDLEQDANRLHALVEGFVAATRSFYISVTDADGTSSPTLPTSFGTEYYYSMHTGEHGQKPHVRVVRVPKEKLEALEPAKKRIQERFTDLSSSMKETEADVISLKASSTCTDLDSVIHQLDTLGKNLLGIQKQFKETASDIDWIFGKSPQEPGPESCI